MTFVSFKAFSKNFILKMRCKTKEDRCQVTRLSGQYSTWLLPYMARLNQPAGSSDSSKQLLPYEEVCDTLLPALGVGIFLKRRCDVLCVINFRWYSFSSCLIAQFSCNTSVTLPEVVTLCVPAFNKAVRANEIFVSATVVQGFITVSSV